MTFSYVTKTLAISTLDRIRMKFFWGGDLEEKKMAWISWRKFTAPMKKGGLGVGSLKAYNLGLLTMWWWRWKTEDQSLWKNVISAIHGPIDGGVYLNGTWANIKKLDQELRFLNISLRNLFFCKIGKGNSIEFWNDNWLENGNLAQRFPRLYA